MQRLILSVLILLFSFNGFTQGWNHRFGGTGQESNNQVIICSDGGFISIGSTTSYSFSEDVFIHKTDSLGKLVWQKIVGGSAVDKGNAVAEDATGNLYVVGETNSAGAGGKDFYVVKLSSTGNILWTNTYGGALDDYATGIVINGSNIYISGTSKNFGSGLDDIYLIKINSAGTLVYANAFGTANTEIGRCMAPVHDGGLLIGGTISYGTTTTGYLVRTNANGDSLWTRIINIGSRNGAGIFGCTELLGDTVFAMTGYGGSSLYGNMVSARVNLTGTTLSVNTSGLLADNGVGITKTSDGGFATSGTYANFGVRAVITKYSYLGDKLWDIRLIQPGGLSYASFSNGMDICETSDHGFILSGINNLSGTAIGAADLMLVKTDSLGNIPQQLYIQPTVIGSASRCVGDSAQISVPAGFDHYRWFRFYTPNYFMWLPDESSNSIYVDSTGNYGCVMYDEDGIYISTGIYITVYKNPDTTMSISGNLNFCSVNDTLTLSVPDFTTVNYLWKKNGVAISGATLASFNPTTSGIYTVTTYNYCDSIVSAPVTVTATATADLTTSVDTLYSNYFLHGNSVCGSQSMSVPFQSGVSYMWYRNGYPLQQTNNVNTIANSAGTYYVIGTNGCGTDTSENVIIITDTVYSTITTPGPLTGCGSIYLNFYATSYSGATYDWYRNGNLVSGGSSSNAYHPSLTGDYYCKITKPCIAFTSVDYTDTINFNYSYTPPSSLTASNGNVACSGSLPVTVNTTANTYQWFVDSVLIPGATSQTYNTTATGRYYCVLSTASCSNLSSNTQFLRFGAPSGTISTTNTELCGNLYRSISLSCPDNSTTYTIQWRRNGAIIPNATSINYSTNIAGVYDCEITNICGSFITNSVILTANTILITTNGNSLCPGIPKVLSANVLPGFNYQWYIGTTTPISGATQTNLTVTASNYYSVKVTSATCTITSSTIFINNNNNNNPDIFCTTVPKFCGNDSVQLVTEQRPDFTYQWYRNGTVLSGQVVSSIYASLGGDYVVQVTDSNNCAVSSPSQFVGASDVGNFSIIPQGSLTICDTASTTLNAGFAGSAYQWSYYGVPISGATQQNITVTNGGLYGVTVTDTQGCSGYASIFVYKNTSPAISVNTITPASCTQSNGGAQINYVPNGSYLWSTGATYTTISNVPAGTYTITVTTNYCPSSLQIQIPATNYLSPSITGDTTICSGDSSMINAGPFPVYLWSTGQSTQYIHPTTTGWYTVTVSDPSQGCSGIDSIFVTVSPSPVVTIAANGPVSFCLGDSVLLDAGSGFNTYKWYSYGNLISGATAQTYYAKTAGPHQCKASISNGCDDISNIINIRIPCMPPQDDDVRIGDEASGEIGVYPNPSSGIYHIEIPEVYKKPFRISVTDLLGKSLMEETSEINHLIINLTTFQEGIYLIKINDGSKSDVLKLVKYD